MHIIKRNNQEIYNLTEQQKEVVKDHLTYDNPEYKNAKRYSRSKYISKPPYLTYYDEHHIRIDGEIKKVLTVPIGVDIPKLLNCKISYKDERVNNQVIYPKFKLELRNDQSKAEQSYLNEVLSKEYPKSIIQLPTGKGKSILALHLAYTLKQKTLILVHKDDLVVGWNADIKLCFGDAIDVGLIKAKKRKVGEQITIATVQTLSNMGEEELNQYVNQFGLVVQDECHHIGINIFNIINKFNSKYKLGLSATPNRSDGLNFVFDLFLGGLCYEHTVTEDDEDICNVEVRVLDSPFKYQPFVHKGQIFNYYDYDSKDLPDEVLLLKDIPYKDRPRLPFLTIDDQVIRSRYTKIMVCKKVIEHYKQGHSVILLFTQKEHINIYYKYLYRYIPKEDILLYYGDSKEDSSVMMNKAENKECLVTLATYAKATEGTNVKSWEIEFLVSSLNNEKNVEQATGRIRRRKEGKLSPVIVYDVRYDNCYSLKSHYDTRKKVYKRLKYTVKDSKSNKGMFSRGYI